MPYGVEVQVLSTEPTTFLFELIEQIKYKNQSENKIWLIFFIPKSNNRIIHLKETQKIANNRIQQIISELKSKSDLIEKMKNTDMFY